MKRRALASTIALAAGLFVLPTSLWAQGALPAACRSFTDDPLTITTPIKAVHIVELRACVNALRGATGLAPFSWTDPTLTPTVSVVRAAHVTEIRAALADVYSVRGGTVPSYTDASLVAGTTGIKRAHISELRIAVQGAVTIPSNHAPTISGPSLVTQFEGAVTSVRVTGADPDSDPLTYSAIGLPSGLSINSTTGVITGTLSTGTFGHFFPAVSVSDGQASASLTIPWTVVGEVNSFVYDSFTGPELSDFRTHVPEKRSQGGNYWRWGAGQAGYPTLLSQQVGLIGDVGQAGWQIYGGRSTVIVAADISSTWSTPSGGLILRYLVSGDYFLLTMPGPSLYRVVQYKPTLVKAAPAPRTMVPGRQYRLEARLIDQQIQVFWNGELLYDYNDPANQETTYQGVYFDSHVDGTLRLDNFEISAMNSQPTLTMSDEQLQLEGASVTVPIVGADREGTPLTYVATGLPAGVSINSSSGVISGTLARGSAGAYSVGVTASDGALTSSGTFTWRVLAPTTTLVFDSFNTVHAENLSLHPVTIAPPWLKWHWLRGIANPYPIADNGYLRTDAISPAEAWTTNVGLADVTLAVDVHSTDPTPYGGMVFRASNDKNYLFLRYDGPSLYRYVNSQYETIWTGHLPFNPGETHRLGVRAVGDLIDVYSDGALVYSTKEAFNKSATRHGVLWSPTDDRTLTFDNFELRSDQPMTGIPYEPNPCEFVLSQYAMSVSSDKGTYGVDAWPQGPNCGPPSAHADSDNMLEEGPEIPIANGYRVTFSVQNNTSGVTRIGYYAIAGHTLRITQAGGSGCDDRVGPFPSSYSSDAHTGLLLTITKGNCDPHPEADQTWIQITGVHYVNNEGWVTFDLDANPSTAGRHGTITIQNTDVPIVQRGVGDDADPPPTEPTPTDPDPSALPVDKDTFYYHTDAIGSVRLITNAQQQEVARYYYVPSGVVIGTPDGDPRMFAGKEHDAETAYLNSWGALDYFGARYYQSQTGRFTSVDPDHVNGDLLDPQSWNGYVYTRNNPLRLGDPDGRRWFSSNGQAVWVDQNQHGIYTSPGDGWVEIDPKNYNHGMNVAYVDGRLSFIGEDANGRKMLALWSPPEQGLEDTTFSLLTNLQGVWGLARLGGTVFMAAKEFGPAIAPLSRKILRQMPARGWTDSMIREAIAFGQQVSAINKATGNAAIRYIHPTTGQSVVVDTVTKEIIHVGGPGFLY